MDKSKQNAIIRLKEMLAVAAPYNAAALQFAIKELEKESEWVSVEVRLPEEEKIKRIAADEMKHGNRAWE